MGTTQHVIRDLVVVVITLAACVFDLRSRRIPNWLTFGAAAGALAFGAFTQGLGGAVTSSAGWAAGAALLLPWFLLGGMGAGDVKLVAAVGAWLGPISALWVALYSAVAGGVFALVLSVAHGYVRKAFANLWVLLGYWRLAGVRPLSELTLEGGRGPRLPYALPIAAGTLVTLWLH